MTDPLECVRLEPGERVLWQGRAAVGAPWPPVLHLLGAGLVALVVVVLGSWISDAHPSYFVLSGGLVTLAVVVILLSKLLGPSYVVLSILVPVVPGAALVWANLVQIHGAAGAFTHGSGAPVAAAIATLVGLPLTMLTLDVLDRLNTVYVITDRRAVAVLASRRLVAWERRHASIAHIRSWRAPRGYLLVRWLWQVRELHLRDDDPATVLA